MSFGKEYIVEIPKLKLGRNEQEFSISRPFFERFNYGPVREGELKVNGVFHKTAGHIDATFHFSGFVMLECDRCTELYPHQLDFDQRILFTFEPVKDKEHDEIVQISRDEIEIDLAPDFFDFIMLEIPLRKVPPKSVHVCPPEVLKMLGITGEEEEEGEGREAEGEGKVESEGIGVEGEGNENEVDPRWSGLEKLKKKFKDN